MLPAEAVAEILPVALGEFRGLAELPRIAAGEGRDLGASLAAAGEAWARAKEIAFERVGFAFSSKQRGTVERAVAEALGRVVGEDPWSRGAPGAPWGPSAQALQKPSGAAAGAPSPRKRGR